MFIKTNDGGIDKVVIPVRGFGLWGTLYGYLALESDLSTIAGLGFYQHKETPDWAARLITLNGSRAGKGCSYTMTAANRQ